MDLKRALRSAISTGRVYLGAKQTNDEIRSGRAGLVVLARNCPREKLSALDRYPDTNVYEYEGTNIELGSMCGKPFAVSSLAVIDPGDSGIYNIRKEKP